MIRTALTPVAPVFKVGDVVAFNPKRFNSSNGTYRVKITEVITEPKPYRLHVFYPALKGDVVSSKNRHFSVGSSAGFYEMRWYDLVPAKVKKPRARLKKFTVFSYDGPQKVIAKDSSNARLNVAKLTGYSADSFEVYAGHLEPL